MTTTRQHATVTWVDLGTTDIERSKDFYQALFGWDYDEFETDEGSYFTALIGGQPVAGMMASAEEQPVDMASMWSVFFSSTDLDGDVARAEEAGGSVVRPPFEIPGGERIAVVADPAGARFALATFSSVGAGRLLQNETGALSWVECHSRDVAASLAFYERFFGWQGRQDGDYHLLEHDGEPVAGLMAVPEGVPARVPSYWFVYWQVDALDDAITRVVEAGGTTATSPMQTDDGRFSVVEDPTGATLGLLERAMTGELVADDVKDRPVSTLTSKYVISVEPEASLRVVVDHFIEGGVSFVVVADSGSVAGVVSEHDVLRAIHDGADIDQIWAADIMSIDLITAEPEVTIGDAARLMIENGVRHLLVFGGRGGVVSIRDVLEAIAI